MGSEDLERFEQTVAELQAALAQARTSSDAGSEWLAVLRDLVKEALPLLETAEANLADDLPGIGEDVRRTGLRRGATNGMTGAVDQAREEDVALTTSQAAAMLGMSRPFLIGLLERGEIPFYKVGRDRRIKRSEVQAYIERREAASQSFQRAARQSDEFGEAIDAR